MSRGVMFRNSLNNEKNVGYFFHLENISRLCIPNNVFTSFSRRLTLEESKFIYYSMKDTRPFTIPPFKKGWPDVVNHLKIDFDWSVTNRREDPILPQHFNFLN